MKTCHIFCAVGFSELMEPIRPGDLTLAADGGLRHTEKLGLEPDGILGDFDSLGFVPAGPGVDRFPVEKDDTDSMLAIKLGLQQGYRRFLIYGALDGPRLDHTVANFQALAYLASHGAVGYLVGLQQIAAVFSSGTLSFPKKEEGILSLFCLGSRVKHISISGLQYPLEDAELTPDFPLGVSNHFVGSPARICWEEGQLLAIWERHLGMPLAVPEGT